MKVASVVHCVRYKRFSSLPRSFILIFCSSPDAMARRRAPHVPVGVSRSKRTGETFTGIVLVESLNGPVSIVRVRAKVAPAIFHSAKSPKLHSIPDCPTCSKFVATRVVRPRFFESPQRPSTVSSAGV